MRPFTRTIIELFDGKRRYLIPLYQRKYAWKVKPQLELLWEDLVRAAQKLESVQQLGAPHFMGAIVIAQVPTYGRQVQAFEVIDGQQRLTTFQLLLIALRDAIQAHSPSYAAEVAKYLANDGVMETPHVERHKLWPSLTDRRAFLGLIDPKLDADVGDTLPEDEDGAVRLATLAHAYFRMQIEAYLFVNGVLDEFKLEKLFEALRVGLAAVSIELEGGDDPQTIFETLNSRGVNLSAGDLMRNFIFQRAKGLGQTDGSLNVDRLYREHWLPLDAWFWTVGDTRGRQTKPRLDWLLVDHLAMKKAALVSVDDLFDSYRRWVLDEKPFAGVEEELRSISASAAIHRRLAEQAQADPLGAFASFAKAFDVSTAMPLVLYLATEADLSDDGLVSALALIQSWIVRRDLCGLQTAGYNRFFVEAIARLRSAEGERVPALAAFLSSSSAEIYRWPADEEFKRAWLGRDQYKPSRQPRLRYIFAALEKKKLSKLNEVVAIKSDLTIEHIMPQKWRQNWPVPGFDHVADDEMDVEQMTREMDRETSINKLGNLTLLTSGLNTTISNGAFSVKMPAVRAQTSLALNRELHSYDVWDESSILDRGAMLFETARTIWAPPG